MKTPKRYHPLLVTLHWIVALLVFTDIYIGLFQIRPALQSRGGFRISDTIIKIHMAVGVTILTLLVIRFIVRLVSKKPAPATAGNKYLDILAKVTHYALYVFVLTTTVLGLIFSLQTNRFQREFLGARGFDPGNFQPGQQPNFPGGNNGAQNFPPSGQRPGNFPPGGPGLGFMLLPIHLISAITLSLLLILHIAAALYHQFFRRDHLLSRMWYGAR